MNVLDEIVQDQLRTDLPVLASGDTVKVSAKVVEGNRERIQVFEGIVMRLRGGGITRSITVRRIASGVGVERTFKINSPRIEKIEVIRHGAGPPRPALLPARPRRQGRDPPRAPHRRAERRRRRPSTPARARPSSDPGPPAGVVRFGRLPCGSMAAIVPTLRHERRLWNDGHVRSSGSTRSASHRPVARSSRRR